MTSLDTALTVLEPSHRHAYERIIALAVDGVDSPNTKRFYSQALEESSD